MDEFEQGIDTAKKKFDTFSSNLENAGKSISNVGGTLTKSVTLPIVGLGTAVIKTGMDYESGMSKVQAISGATGDEMDLLGQKAMEMASKTKFSTSDSAEAYQYMAMAGWKAGDMVDGLSGIMNLAAASGENLGTTSDIVTDALTAFGLKASDSGRFADVLAAASNNANTNVSMLGESFKYVAPVAGAMGYSVEDTSIALGLMANSGIKASQAGTSLRTVLTNMAKPTSAVSDAMALLGVNIEDEDGKMYSLSEIMDQLRTGFKGGTIDIDHYNFHTERLSKLLAEGKIDLHDYSIQMEALDIALNGTSESQQAEIAAMLAGKEGMSGLLAIVNAAPEDYQKLTEAIKNSNGTTEEMAAIMQDNAAGAFEKLKSAIDVLFTKISETLLPIFTSVVEKLTDWVNWFGELDDGTQNFILAIAGIVAAVGPVLSVIGNIVSGIGGIASAISGVIGIGSKLMGGLSSLFSLIATNPVIAIIGAVIGAIVLLYTKCEWFRDMVHAVIDAVVGFFQAAWEVIQAAWSAVVDFFSGIVDGIKAVFEGIGEFLGRLFEGAWEAVKNAWNAAVDFFRGIWEGIKTVFSVVVDVLGGFFTAAWEAIKKAWSAVVGFFSGVWDGIQKVFSVVAKVLGGFFSSAWEAIKGVWNAAVGFFTGVWQGIQGVFSTVAEVLGGFFSAAWEAVKSVWEAAVGVFQGISNGIHAAFEAVTSFLSEAFSAAWNLISSIWSAAVGFFQGVWAGISGAFSSVAAWFGGVFSNAWNAVTKAWNGVTKFFQGVWKNITGVFSNAWNVFTDIGGAIVRGLWNGITALAGWLWGKVTGFFGSIVDGVKGMLGIASPSKVFASIGGNMARGIGVGWDKEYAGVARNIENGLDFGNASVGVSYGPFGASRNNSQAGPGAAGAGRGDTVVNIYSPEAVDGVQAARVWRKEVQKMAVSYI